ncbi:MAG: heparinase II/III family protein [Sphingomonadaceae bacterium]
MVTVATDDDTDPAIAEGQTIVEGKRLVKVRNDVGLSLSERIANQFYRLTWRTPLHGLRLRGRHPLKLLAVPKDAFAGDKALGSALLDGALHWRGERVAIADLSFTETNWSRGFSDHVHSFVWLRNLDAAAPRAQAAPVAEAIMRKWLAAHGEKVTEPAWRSDLWGQRILNLAAHAPLILSSQDLVYRSSVLNALARGARHLDQTADRAVFGLQRISAWIGIVAAGLLIAGGKPRQAFGEAGLAKALVSGIGSDGGIICRTPHNQAELVILLSMLRNVYDARQIMPPGFLIDALMRAVPALLAVTLGDGGLSSWQGSAPAPAGTVEAIIAGSQIRARPLRQPRDWGYHRLAADQTVMVVDAAPPPVSRVMGGGCASTLAFEVSDGVHRLVINCGGANAGGIHLPASLAEGLRTTAAHSTLIIADSNSTAIHADGTLGKGVTEVALDRQENEGSSRIEATHDGYAKRFGLTHRRTINMSADGREIRGEDVLLPAEKKRKRATFPFAIRFHLGPDVEPTPTADSMGALLRIDGGALWQFRARGGALQIDESLWIDGEGRVHSSTQLVVLGEVPPGGATIGWAFKRAG